ncbi:MAG: electron transfer flavoprotein subunit alpha/FixB family protein [Clostridiales bacterium]|nr:electron transfer flavoprotein subunit alpha/FixB family protein [Clostridiales bacterium]
MTKGIWVIIEQTKQAIRKASLELLSKGRLIADETGELLVAVIPGKGVFELAKTAVAYGADKVILIEDDRLENYTTGAYTSVLNKLVREEEPQMILMGNTAIGKDLMPRLAQRLGVGMASDCIGIEMDSETFVHFVRPIYGGKAFAKVALTEHPMMATVRPNTFKVGAPDETRKAEIVNKTADIDSVDLRAIVKEIAHVAGARPELAEADIIISGGRGMRGAENYKMLEECADVIGAAVGASRAAVDAGWMEEEFQVGQTGKTVSPTLYIACGISGSIQHLAGMSSSKVIVAINKDPDADIFTVADYGIVGDLFEIVPMLTEEFKKMMA